MGRGSEARSRVALAVAFPFQIHHLPCPKVVAVSTFSWHFLFDASLTFFTYLAIFLSPADASQSTKWHGHLETRWRSPIGIAVVPLRDLEHSLSNE